MNRRSRIVRTALLGLGVVLTATGGAGAMPIPNYTNLLQAPVKSYVELRFKNVIRQTRDVSCGAAALATLLHYYYGDQAVGENAIIEAAFEIGDEAKIRQDGFSMLELKRVGQQHGYVAQGFKIADVEDLRQLRVPVLTLVNTRGYEHFVVLKGIEGDQVFIADPAFGNRARPIEVFAEEWRNVILVLLSPDRPGQDAFAYDHGPRGRMSDLIPLLDRTLVTIRRSGGEF
ncbi:MAG: C39 family peptidase [Geminicoccaceae bacterium]|nr:C39 family peptidase [Geminicoccaceae bacterium]